MVVKRKQVKQDPPARRYGVDVILGGDQYDDDDHHHQYHQRSKSSISPIMIYDNWIRRWNLKKGSRWIVLTTWWSVVVVIFGLGLCVTTIIFLLHSEKNPLDILLSYSMSQKTPTNNTNLTLELVLNEFELLDYLGRRRSSASNNIMFRSQIRNEQIARKYDLWDSTNNHPVDVVVEYIDPTTTEYGRSEIMIYERMMKIDKMNASSVGLMQPIWLTDRHVPNPFYCPIVVDNMNNNIKEWNDKICIDKYHSQPHVAGMSDRALTHIRSLKTVDIVILPYYEERYIKDTTIRFSDVVTFFESMLEQLMVAHEEGGVNNVNLQVNRNMYVARDSGRAIMFDWTSYVPVGGAASHSHQSWSITAPEAWLWSSQGINATNVNIHALDIWQAGVVWANFIYGAPCEWKSPQILIDSPLKTDHEEYWKSLITTLGGNTSIPINASASIDVRTLAGMPTTVDVPIPKSSDFKPFLQHCSDRIDHVVKVPSSHKESAEDLLLQMLRINPMDRPTAREVLRHQFFEDYDH
jgi:serine/threonine protein kinase